MNTEFFITEILADQLFGSHELGALRREMADLNARFALSERGLQVPRTAEGTLSLTPGSPSPIDRGAP
ncbi:unnamed protein product [Pieris macdunnoughi]|uniref:Uncharacterized protein n=1 Tax=Pieris macdunnoughi TaxID=345717 RepID=A0A821UJJ7_9NEOP|nr:unnamed protein product [Pieris macdunnoughi]